MQFNDRESIPLSDLKAAMSEVPEPEFKRHLLSLCTPKYRILKKSSAGKVYYMMLIYGYVCITVLITGIDRIPYILCTPNSAVKYVYTHMHTPLRLLLYKNTTHLLMHS